MDILDGLEATVYIDDVFIADDTEEEHLEKLQKVIERLHNAGLKLNLKKCQFGKHQVNYLGFQISDDLGLSEEYRKKVEQVEPPGSLNDLQKILGLFNYVRDHVPGYQKYAKPLYAKLRKVENPQGPEWEWTATDQQHLEDLRKAIQGASKLEPRSHTARLVAEITCEEKQHHGSSQQRGRWTSGFVELHPDSDGDEVSSGGEGAGCSSPLLECLEGPGAGTRHPSDYAESGSSISTESYPRKYKSDQRPLGTLGGHFIGPRLRNRT